MAIGCAKDSPVPVIVESGTRPKFGCDDGRNMLPGAVRPEEANASRG